MNIPEALKVIAGRSAMAQHEAIEVSFGNSSPEWFTDG